jgi:DNA-binding NarL/FixJ family response regulator
MGIRVLLADDHRMVRDGLRALIQSEKDLEVIAEAEDGRTAVRLAAETSPDVVVMDISMPDLNGIDATRQIMTHDPDVKVVALTAYADPRMVSNILGAGASGYLPKDAAFEELAVAIRTVAARKVYLSPHATRALVREAAPRTGGTGSQPGGAFEALTPREREVLQLMAEGKATKEIAAVLHVSVKTVETHRRQMMDKLNLDSVAEVTKYALREGLTSLDM